MVFVFFASIMIGGLIQRAPLIESPPSPVPSLLGDFSFTLLSVLLSFPYLLLLFGLSLAGVVPLYGFSWLGVIGNLVYLYLLSCFTVSSLNRYKHRYSKWYWITILGIPFALVASFLFYPRILHFGIDDLLLCLGIALIASLYLHLLSNLGFFLYDAIVKSKVSAA